MSDAMANGRYRIVGELGRGGMGVVYRAHDTLLDRPVAVKVLSAEGLGAEGRTRLLAEAQAAAKLNHPNIVAVYDAGEAALDLSGMPAPPADAEPRQAPAGPLPYLVMELVDGQTLHDHRPASLDELLAIAQQILAALDHAHAHGIVHRDLKPENVLLAFPPRIPDPQSPSASAVVAKLMDFGLARSVASRLTAGGVTIAGSVFYLAPELALGQPFDGRADLYSLGVMLYELSTGRLPFTAGDPLAVISQHLHAPVVPPRAFRADLPPGLEAIILQLLAKNPEDRPATAQRAARALAEVMAVGVPAAEAVALPGTGGLALLEGLARGRIVGRREELSQLRRLWARALEGHGHMALITGEPGVGKTRLAHEVTVAARLSAAEVLQGGCYEYEAATPYLPFVEALRAWVHPRDAQALAATLGPNAAELARLAPEIDAKLGPLAPNPLLPAHEERLRLFDHVSRFLQTLAAERGLLLFIDDLHWADHGTLALLHYLSRNLRHERLLILAAYREVELDRSHPLAAALVEWNRERLAARVPLGRLAREDTRAMLATLFGQDSVSTEFGEAMFRETEGNPFFVEEVVKTLIEQGQIYRENGGWGRREIAELTIPQSVKEAIGRRLNRLSPAGLDALHTAAGLGKTFEFAELAAASSAVEEQLLDALDEAVAAQLIRAGGGETFTFTHDKIREVLYEELNPIRRRRLHQRIGEALESLHAAGLEPHVPDLAHHFAESGDLGRALEYSLRAAKNAERLFAHDEALGYYERARESAEGLDRPGRVAEVHEAIGDVHAQRGAAPSSVEAYERALALAATPEARARIKSKVAAVHASVGDARGMEVAQAALRELNPETQAAALAMTLANLGRYHHYRGAHLQAMEFFERAQQMAEPLDDSLTLTNIYGYLAGGYQHLTRFCESMEWARRCIALGEAKDFPFACAIGYEFLAEGAFSLGRWQDALEFADRDRDIGRRTGALDRVAWGEFSRAHALHGMGRLADAEVAARTSLALAESTGDLRLAVIAGAILSIVHTDSGEEDSALSVAELAVVRGNELAQVYMQCISRHALASLHARRGEWSRAVALFEECDAILATTGNRVTPLSIGADQAQAYWGAGRLDEAARRIRQYTVLARYSGSRHFLAVGRRVQGQVLAAQEAWDEAAASFDKAVAALHDLGSRLELARALHHRGLLRRTRDDRSAAREDWTRAQALFAEAGASGERKSVQGLLGDSLHGRSA